MILGAGSDPWHRDALELAPVILLGLDAAGRVAHASPYYERLSGWTLAEILGRDWLSLGAPAQARGEVRSLLASLVEHGTVAVATHPIVLRDGSVREIEWRHRRVDDPATSTIRVLAVGLDRTEQIRAERALRERERALSRSERLLADAQQLARVGSWELDLGAQHALWSSETYRIVEVDPAQKDGLFETFLSRLHPDDRARGMENFESMLLTRQPVDHEARLVMPDGRIKHVRQRASFMSIEDATDTGTRRMVGTIEDVTERHRVEQTLLELEQQRAALIHASPVGVYRLNAARACEFVNARLCEILDIPSEDALGEGWRQAMHPDDVAGVRQEWQESQEQGRPYRLEHRFVRRDGGVVWVLGQGVSLKDASGAVIGYMGTVTDITELRHTESAMRAERTLLRSLIDAFPGIIGLHDADGRQRHANATLLARTGRQRGEEDGTRVEDLSHWRIEDGLRAHSLEAFARARSGISSDFDAVVPMPDGKSAELQVAFRPIRSDGGDVTHVATFGIDVSERNAAVARLNEAQRLAKLGSWELDLVTGELLWSDEIFRLFEIDPAGFAASYEAFLELVHPDDRPTVDAAYKSSVQTRKPYQIEHRLALPDGRIKWVHERCETFYDPDGNALRSVGTVQDVTERVVATKQAARSRDLLRAIIDSSPDMVFLKSHDHRLLLANATFERVFGLSSAELIGRLDVDVLEASETRATQDFIDGLHEDDRQVLTGTWLGPQSTTFRIADVEHVFELTKLALRDPDGRGYAILGYGRDVTAERTATEALRRNVAEKETLLREIHHRVKNNLQMISSLLHFRRQKADALPHASSLDGVSPRAVFDDARVRLDAMALVHEQLYQSRDLACIDLVRYLRALVDSLGQASASAVVRVESSEDVIAAPTEAAPPLGMIVTELVMNAAKHAFPGDRTGVVGVLLRREGERLALVVQDDGIGIPESIDAARAKSFGLRLVRSLARQLDATLSLERLAPGSRITLAFALPTRTTSSDVETTS